MIVEMTGAYAEKIAGWAYPGVYVLYNMENDAEPLLDGSYFVRLEEGGELTGFFCFGASARIPTRTADAYGEGFLDVGLGMRPDLCGRGGGAAFLAEGLTFARTRFGVDRFRLTVAAFNVRAIRAYEKAGFAIERSIERRGTGIEFFIMTGDARREERARR